MSSFLPQSVMSSFFLFRGRETRFKKLSDTRLSCQHDTIAAVMATYSAILETLEKTTDSDDRMKAIEVTGILAGVKSYDYIVSLVRHYLEKLLFLIQASINTLEGLRSDHQWYLLWQESVAFANSLCPILSQYSDVFPQGNVDNQISTFKNYLERNPQIETATDSTE